MKRTYLGLVLVISILLSGCISEEENTQIIFERDVKAIQDFVARNPIPAVKELVDNSTGLSIYWTRVSGSGKLPSVGDTVFVDYVGKFLDLKVFDTSIESVARANNIFSPSRNYVPLDVIFGLGEVVPGFEFALSKMELGDKATVLMPSLFGYGAFERGIIPKNSPLIFELEIINIQGPGQ
jgi:FKBP-type peptidyl-prolyl cis-trans isomerase